MFFFRKDSRRRFTGRFDSLADASIGVVSATSYGSRFDSAVQAGTFKKLEPVTSHETNFRKLLAGRIDTVICSRLVGLYYLDLLNGLGEVNIGGPSVETTFSYLVFTKQRDFTALSRQFDHALEAMARWLAQTADQRLHIASGAYSVQVRSAEQSWTVHD